MGDLLFLRKSFGSSFCLNEETVFLCLNGHLRILKVLSNVMEEPFDLFAIICVDFYLQQDNVSVHDALEKVFVALLIEHAAGNQKRTGLTRAAWIIRLDVYREWWDVSPSKEIQHAGYVAFEQRLVKANASTFVGRERRVLRVLAGAVTVFECRSCIAGAGAGILWKIGGIKWLAGEYGDYRCVRSCLSSRSSLGTRSRFFQSGALSRHAAEETEQQNEKGQKCDTRDLVFHGNPPFTSRLLNLSIFWRYVNAIALLIGR